MIYSTRKLRCILKTIPLGNFEGSLYRCLRANTLYGFSKTGPFTPRPLYNLGSLRTGGARYTPKDGATSLYLASDIDTAIREHLGISYPLQLQPELTTTRVFYSAK